MKNRIQECVLPVLFFLFLQHCLAGWMFSGNCRSAYTLTWQYKIADAKSFIDKEQKQNPSNGVPLYLESLGDFIRIFAEENAGAFTVFKETTNKRLSKLEECGQSSPWYYFCRSEILIHDAILRLKFGETMSAALDLNKAYRNLGECVDKYPDFLPAKKDYLLMTAAVGTVPQSYQWAMRVLGFSGDLLKSMADYRKLVIDLEDGRQYSIFHDETEIYYAYMCYYLLNKPEAAWQEVKNATGGYLQSPVYAFARANIGLRAKKNDAAIQALEPYIGSAPQIFFLDYMYGIALLQKCNTEGGFYIARYLRNHKGKQYLKDAYLRLGWAFLLKGDLKNYDNTMKLVAYYGSTQLEEDRNALRESKLPAPNLSLLRARLLFDGGYFNDAKSELVKLSPEKLGSDYSKAEYYYRLGRVTEALGDNTSALASYRKVYSGFPSADGYFAPAACLYSGMIYEKLKDLKSAKEMYLKCLSYRNYVFKDSFDQKANAGLKRIG